MDIQTVVNVLGGAALAVLGWFARTLWEAVNALRRDHEQHRVEVAKDYTPKADFKGAIDKLATDMKDSFSRLFDRLDGKADK